MPARYAPPGGPVFAVGLAGHRLAVPVAKGAALAPEMLVSRPLAPEDGIERGQRAADVVATADPRAVVAGAHVDVVVTTDHASRLALEDVEVLAAHALAPAEDKPPRVTATLRVGVRQAVYLAAAQTFAREIRLLARAPGDHRRAGDLQITDRVI
jgi:pilus assembly protein CpaB